MNVTGTVFVDLRGVDEDKVRGVVETLIFAPAGAQAVLLVGDQCFVDFGAVHVIRDYAGHLAGIDVHGTPDAVLAWVRALRKGGW